jgi:hypothetical protein
LVPVVDGTFGQVNKPRSGHAGQNRGQIVGLYHIVTASGLNSRVVDLDELFGIAGDVILVDQSRLELVGSSHLPELGRQSTERVSP